MTDLCVCGHVFDEHDPRSCACDIEDCDCFYFEAYEEDES